MINLFKKKIKLVEGTVIELKPNRKYLLMFNRNDISESDAISLGQALHKENMRGIIVMIAGNPRNIVLVEKDKLKKEAKSDKS